MTVVIFLFESDHFYKNFAMGRLIYQKIAVPSEFYLNYITGKGQRVTLQRLNLEQDKIIQMKDFLDWSIRKENNSYLYHHYRDNCSTRIRDVIDFALDGQLREENRFDADASYRSSFRRYTHHAFWADFLLSLLQGRGIDSGISVWDTMFLPDELMHGLDRIILTHSDGSKEPLVLEKKILAQAEKPRIIPDTPPGSTGKAAVLGLLTGMLILVLTMGVLGRNDGWGKAARLGIALVLCALGLIGGLFFFISFFTDHDVATENINILVVHPLYLLLAVFILKRWKPLIKKFWQIQLGSWFVMTFLNLWDFHQENSITSLFFLALILPQFMLTEADEAGFCSIPLKQQKLPPAYRDEPLQ